MSADSVIKIFDHRIEFFNPGRFPKGLTVEKLMANDYISVPRNKLIANICKDIGWIEKYGSGIQRVCEYFANDKLPIPKFEEIAEGVRVTVYSNRVTDKVTDKVTDNQQKLMEQMKIDNRITTMELAEKIGISQRKTKENIKKLKEMGLLSRVGSEKNGYWKVN